MTPLHSTPPAALPDLMGRDVINKVGDPIGTVGAMWSDPVTGKLEFIGVKTGWFSGALHVIPTPGVLSDEARGRVVLPYTNGQVEDAPTFDAGSRISDADEVEIYRYYGIQDRSGIVPAEGASGATTRRAGPAVNDPNANDAADYTAGTGKGGFADTTAK